YRGADRRRQCTPRSLCDPACGARRNVHRCDSSRGAECLQPRRLPSLELVAPALLLCFLFSYRDAMFSVSMWQRRTAFMRLVLAGGMLLFAFRASAQPYAATLEPVIFSANSGALSGMGTPGPFPSSMWFEWGTSYEHRTQVFDFPAGDRVVYLQPPISGLVPGQIYQCRMVVSNQAGVARGFPRRLGIAKTVRAWGGNEFGQATVPPLSNPVAAAGGSRHSVVLQSN